MNAPCETCRFFSANERLPGMGQCRRRSPYFVPSLEKHRTQWPLVRTNNWCGEHEAGAA